MKTISKFILIFVLLGLVCIAFIGIPISSSDKETGKEIVTVQNTNPLTTPPVLGLSRIVRTNGPIQINATVSLYSNTIPVYQGVMGKNDTIDLELKSSLETRSNVTSVKDAPEVVKRLLQPYGGLPADAEMTGAGVGYLEYWQNSTLLEKKPTATTVTYARLINGMWILGDSNRIRVELGNDELLSYFKEWRNYSFIGEVPIITPDAAIDKLEREELIESSIHPEDGNVTIDMIALGYYAKNAGGTDTILEPIWMFYGKSHTRPRLGLYVYARQFANFTATPTTATPSDEIKFRISSDGSPTSQFWDFGDGTNSTIRNPVHTYSRAGTYNITLKVWNDLGSDSLTKSRYITILREKESAGESSEQPRSADNTERK